MKSLHYIVLSIIVLIVGCSFSLDAQHYQVTFGKNTIQHQKSQWMQYETERFVVYWSEGNKTLAESVLQLAEWDYSDVQKKLEYRILRKIKFVIYSNYETFKGHNVGYTDPRTNNTSGESLVTDFRIPIYFDGNHQHLRRQIRRGIAQVYIRDMVVGSNFQEALQNAVLLRLPNWYMDGLEAFVGETWNTDLDSRMRDIILSEKYNNFLEFAKSEPELAGHSMWYFVNSNFGKSMVSNLVYLTRVNRSVEGGFLYVLGTPFEQIKQSWQYFYNQRYKQETHGTSIPDSQFRVPLEFPNKQKIIQIKANDKGTYLAYVSYYRNIGRVWLHNRTNGTKKVAIKYKDEADRQGNDYSQPLLAWSPNGNILSVVHYKKSHLVLSQINTSNLKKETQRIEAPFDQIHSMEYISDTELLLSATSKGNSDIFIYSIPQNATKRLTQDKYDNIQATPAYINGQDGYLFCSNRGEDTYIKSVKRDSLLNTNSFDVYFLANDSISRLTNTPFANESHPIALGTHYTFLSDKNGIRNLFLGEKSSNPADSLGFLSYPVSSYENHIWEASQWKQNEILIRFVKNGTSKLYSIPLDSLESVSMINTTYRQQLIQKKVLQEKVKQEQQKQIEEIKKPKEEPALWEFETDFSTPKTTPKDSIPTSKEDEIDFVFVTDYLERADSVLQDEKIDIDNYEFANGSETKDDDNAIYIEDEDGRTKVQTSKISFAKPIIQKENRRLNYIHHQNIKAYRPQYQFMSLTTQIDNGLVMGGYDNYIGTPYKHTPLGFLLQGKMQDVLENYGLDLATRVPLTFRGLEVWMKFKNKKGRWNKEWTYYRKHSKNPVRTRADIPPIFHHLEEALPLAGSSNLVLRYTYNFKNTTNLLRFKTTYPLNKYSRIEGQLGFRLEDMLFTANDLETLHSNHIRSQRLSAGLTYTYDDTKYMDVNLRKGLRFQVYGEAYQRTNFQPIEGKFGFQKGLMTILGIDARHYLPLGKHIVFATRVTAATSLGSERMLFNFGGATNQIFNKDNSLIPVPDVNTENFVYQTTVGSMRGFRSNTRNGNSFFLGNAEVRIPLFRLFSNKPSNAAFLRYFQIIGFVDAGTAWQGKTPFSNNNPLNSATIAPPVGAPQIVVVNVDYYRDPIVAAYGVGVRSKIFGYFLRLDYGVGIETQKRQKGILHFSIGTDF